MEEKLRFSTNILEETSMQGIYLKQVTIFRVEPNNKSGQVNLVYNEHFGLLATG